MSDNVNHTAPIPTAIHAPSRNGRLTGTPALLFAYGTLQHPAVLRGLLGRIPASVPATAPGWRAAQLRGRVYPGLVPSPRACAPGLLLTDVTTAEWSALDDFEDPSYDLRPIKLASRITAASYVWTVMDDVLPHTWSLPEFEQHVPAYTSRFTTHQP